MDYRLIIGLLLIGGLFSCQSNWDSFGNNVKISFPKKPKMHKGIEKIGEDTVNIRVWKYI